MDKFEISQQIMFPNQKRKIVKFVLQLNNRDQQKEGFVFPLKPSTDYNKRIAQHFFVFVSNLEFIYIWCNNPRKKVKYFFFYYEYIYEVLRGENELTKEDISEIYLNINNKAQAYSNGKW